MEVAVTLHQFACSIKGSDEQVKAELDRFYTHVGTWLALQAQQIQIQALQLQQAQAPLPGEARH